MNIKIKMTLSGCSKPLVIQLTSNGFDEFANPGSDKHVMEAFSKLEQQLLRIIEDNFGCLWISHHAAREKRDASIEEGKKLEAEARARLKAMGVPEGAV
jgi:hypothetical protein